MPERNRTNKTQKPIDYGQMMLYINELTEKYSFLSYTSIGETLLGKSIPLISIGEGKQEILYVGAHMGSAWGETACLLKFIEELCKLISTKSKIYFYDSLYLFKTKTISVIPMLNPDGVDYNINGTDESNPLFERVLKMNGGSADFSCWNSNARGVDLDKNYVFSDRPQTDRTENDREGREGEWPERERETGSLCNYLRYNTSIKLILALYSFDDEYIHVNSRFISNYKTTKLSQIFNRRIVKTNPDKFLNFGLSKWCEANTNIPMLSVVDPTDRPYSSRYLRLREGLFSIPIIF